MQRICTSDSLGRGELMPYLLRLSGVRRLTLVMPESVFQLHRLGALRHLHKIVLTETGSLDLTPLQALPSLRVLTVQECGHLAGLTSLELTRLHLWETDCASYTALSTLQVLKLDVLDSGLQDLPGLTRLRLLYESSDSSQMALFRSLSKLPRLRALNSAAGPASYPALASLQQLTALTLSGDSDEPTQLTMLSALSRLRRLVLHQVLGLPHISLPCLTALLLLYNDPTVGQASLPQLHECSELKVLHLRLDVGHCAFLVAIDKLPAHRVELKHSRLTGELYLHADLHHVHSIQAVPVEQVQWDKMP